MCVNVCMYMYVIQLFYCLYLSVNVNACILFCQTVAMRGIIHSSARPDMACTRK
ncbi:hypothetical protein Hanom_Chr02g00122701 [Helianthus anomalus]